MSLINPELQRNLWLELTPQRLLIVPMIIGLFFLPGLTVASDPLPVIARTGVVLYYILVLLWGTRMAAGAVVGEVRARTWDNQRLSSLSAAELMWGKLIGAPILVWYGGAICLVPIVLNALFENGIGAALGDIAYYLSIGLFAQSISLLSSLLFLRRRPSISWLDTFLFQLAGLVAGGVAASVWNSARYVDEFTSITWYGSHFASEQFALVSLLIFMGWALFGNWRLMRRELQVRNSSLGFGLFLGFMMVYFAGFANLSAEGWGQGGRLFIAALVASGMTYAMLILEAKDAVSVRRLFGRLFAGRVDQFLAGMPSWMLAYVGALVAMLAFVLTFDPLAGTDIADQIKDLPQFPGVGDIQDYQISWRALLLAFLMFVTRDMAIFLMFNFSANAKRADFVAVLWLLILYVIVPTVLASGGSSQILALFLAYPTSPVWLGPLLPAAEAAVILVIAWRRLFNVKTGG